jgi:hypothetical protein
MFGPMSSQPLKELNARALVSREIQELSQLADQAEPRDIVLAIQRIAKEPAIGPNQSKAKYTADDRLALSVLFNKLKAPDRPTALVIAEVVETLVEATETHMSGNGFRLAETVTHFFGLLGAEEDQVFRSRLAHTTLQLATTGRNKFLYYLKPLVPYLTAAGEDLTDSVLGDAVIAHGGLREAHMLGKAAWAELLAVTPPEVIGAVQLQAIARQQWDDVALLETTGPYPWPVAEYVADLTPAQASPQVSGEEVAAFVAGLEAVLASPQTDPILQQRLYEACRAARPRIAEALFVAEEQRAHILAHRPAGTAARPRPRSPS